MDMILLKNFCAGTETALAQADEALNRISANETNGRYSDPDFGELESKTDSDIFVYHIQRCAVMLSIGLDALGLTSTQQKLLQDWQVFKSTGLHKTSINDLYGGMESAPLYYLHSVYDGLKIMNSEPQNTLDNYLFERLCSFLKSTAVLIRKKGIIPNKEHDIQHIMHDYLDAFFPDFVRDPKISGAIKNFKPDCGILSLSVAIEFKYVNSETEMKTALSGIFEDIAGYSGSKDWTRFVSVIYQTAPFESGAKFEADLKRIKAHSWISILVNGSGDRKKQK